MGKLFEYETKRVLPRIEAILSVEEDRKGELRSWIRQCKFEDDLASFYAISESATHKLNAQWMKSILAALPDRLLFERENMNEDVLPFFDACPRNNLMDYLLAFERVEKLILGKYHPNGLPAGVKEEYKKNRKIVLCKIGGQAQEIIDWWAKKQAREHKKAIEQGCTISIIKGKGYGKRISKHKYEKNNNS